MPRKPRLPHYPGHIFHVIGRGNGGAAIAHDQEDGACFFRALGDIKRRAPFSLFAYCLMPNHYHLLIQVNHVPLAAIMRRFLTSYAMRIHGRYGTRGHLFEARYKAIHCPRDSYFMELLRYIHLNPVRAGLVVEPGQWSWSGHNELLGYRGRGLIDRDFPLSLFGAPNEAIASYLEFMKRGMDAIELEAVRGLPPGPLAEIARDLNSTPPQREQLKDILERCAAGAGVMMEEVLSKSKRAHVTEVRRRIVMEGLQQGYGSGEIARFLRRDCSTISGIIRRADD